MAAPHFLTRRYTFPPGMQHNLIWYAGLRFRPGNPIALFEHLAREFGDIAHYKLGPKHIVFLNHPAYIREVLVVQPAKFIKERTVRRSRLVLGEGMITAEGEYHRAQRRLAQPAFHRERVRGYADTIAAIASERRDSWRDGTVLDISDEMMTLSLEIVSQTLFGVELGAAARELADAVNRIMEIYNYLILLPAAELLVAANVPLRGLRRYLEARRAIDDCVARIVARAAQLPVHEPATLIQMLLEAEDQSDAATRRRLRDQVVTIFLAGYETVANALTWTWYLLSQNPEPERRLHAELDAVLGSGAATLDDIPRLPYTAMVLAESMRLFPPAWAMGRIAIEDFEIGGYRLPRGTTVLMSQYIMHRDPRYFPDPLSFRPERFTEEEKSRRERLSYFPFGAGPRQCIGEAFAWTEATLVLATLARRWRPQLVPGHPVEPQPLITLRPKFGMRMTLHDRFSAE